MVKVTVCGAAGGIGQPLSLLLKLNNKIDELSLFDVVNVPGVGADLSHICTNAKIESFLPADDGMNRAMKDSDLVIIPAGVPRKPGMTRDDLFNINAGIVRDLAQGIATSCPNAFILVISNPVNSTVPIFAEVLKKNGVFKPSHLFGVTTLDIVRANTFISEIVGKKPTDFSVPVIGGHSGETIVPIYSLGASANYADLDQDAKTKLIHRVQFGGDEVVQAKNGAGSATLSMAYAGYRLAERLLDAISGESNVVECTFLNLDDSIKGAAEAKKLVKGLSYFSLPVVLGPKGIEEVKYDILNKINDEEKELLAVAIDQLEKNIVKGVSFIKGA